MAYCFLKINFSIFRLVYQVVFLFIVMCLYFYSTLSWKINPKIVPLAV